jgi:3-polyprenyl-4-hydroxybenzoate decarboxylase
MHNTSEVLFRLCANTDPQRDRIFTKGPSDVLDHATSEIASGSKLGIDATEKNSRRPIPSGLTAVNQDGCAALGKPVRLTAGP